MAQTFVVKCSSCHDGDLILDANNKLVCNRCARYALCVACNSKNIALFTNPGNLFQCKDCNCVYERKFQPNKFNPIRPDFTGNYIEGGILQYYKDGRLHRLDGAAVHNSKTGLSEYWIDGKRHHDIHSFTAAANEFKDKNTVDSNPISKRKSDEFIEDRFGNKRWYNKQGQLHREEGHAVCYGSGKGEYWINGIKLASRQEHGLYVANLNWFRKVKSQKPIIKDGSKIWLNSSGQRHREDGPAVIHANGKEDYWLYGQPVLKTDVPIVDDIGNRTWFDKKGELHRDKDQPAIISIEGSRFWYFHGVRHRENGPAVALSDGTKHWYFKGAKHRIGGPAIENSNGKVEYWYSNQKYDLNVYQEKTKSKKPVNSMTSSASIRLPIIHENGTAEWRSDKGQTHRTDGPAIILINGDKYWYCFDKQHRIDGPAVEGIDGYKEWWFAGIRFENESDYAAEIKKHSFGYEPRKSGSFEGLDGQGNRRYYEYIKGEKVLHRLDGPAVIYTNGTKEWRVNGKLHRIDGPAIEFFNGDREWRLNGELHREDGPAMEYSGGRKEWYIKGKLHRENGPAIEYANGAKEYYLNGESVAEKAFLFDSKKDAPPIVSTGARNGKYTDRAGREHWYKNDLLHREDGPAFIDPSGVSQWYKNGKLHREDGPAVVWKTGTAHWYIEGIRCDNEEHYQRALNVVQKNKLNSNPPKTPQLNGLVTDKVTKVKRWYKDGKVHREDGPALVYDNGDEEWFFENKPHRDFGPAVKHKNVTKWYKHGTLHREDGPALEWKNGVKYWMLCGRQYKSEKSFNEALTKLAINRFNSTNKDNLTGLVINPSTNDQSWYLNGKLHRPNGPALIFENGDQSWYLNGKLHRENGPAIMCGHNNEAWYIDGKPHREDGPAIIKVNGDKEWYKEGKLHREDGPAIERSNSKNEFWLNGVKQSEFDFPVTDKEGNKTWYNENHQKHRLDGPALIHNSGTRYWYQYDLLHREDGPAVEYVEGFATWHLRGIKYDDQKQYRKALEILRGEGKIATQESKTKPEYLVKKNDGKYATTKLEADSNSAPKIRFDNFGNKFWYSSDNKLHRSKGPAAEYKNGTKKWYWRGKLHRRNNPAVIYASGGTEWFIHGERHREDGPAIESSNGKKSWYLNGQHCRNLREFNSKKKVVEPNEESYQIISGDRRWVDSKGELHCNHGPALIEKNGDKFWYNHGKLHRCDGPAIEESNGTKKWFQYGKLHRTGDQPAIEYSNGDKAWHINGQLNRGLKRPSIETVDGRKYWHKDSKLHREDGPAIEYPDGRKDYYLYGTQVTKKAIELRMESSIEYSEDNGVKEWRFNGRLHREFNPARIFEDGTKEWWKNGKLHREDGPAVEFSDGRTDWYKHGIRVSPPQLAVKT